MTYDQWFRSQQGIPYEGQYLFAEAAWTHQLTRIIDLHTENTALKEQVAQQATVIEQMRDALHLAANNMNYVGAKNWDIIANALLLQPSPEILQARDEQVAEACAKIVNPSSLTYITRGDALTAIRSNEWRKYL